MSSTGLAGVFIFGQTGGVPLRPLASPRFALLCLAVLALVAAAGERPARACSCRMPTILVLPGPQDPAPTNTHVWIEVPWAALAPDTRLDALTFTVRERRDKPAPAPKRGRRKPPPPPPAPVEVERRDLVGPAVGFVELAPKAPLAARKRFEVVMARAGGKEAVVGELVTGADADAAAPTWGGVAKATYVHAPAVCCNCTTGNPYAVLALASAPAGSPPEPVVYAVWTAPEGGAKIDYQQPPAAWAQDSGGSLLVGDASTCTPANLAFPAAAAVKGGKLRLGVRPIDRAGNPGDPSEVVVDLRKPAKAKP